MSYLYAWTVCFSPLPLLIVSCECSIIPAALWGCRAVSGKDRVQACVVFTGMWVSYGQWEEKVQVRWIVCFHYALVFPSWMPVTGPCGSALTGSTDGKRSWDDACAFLSLPQPYPCLPLEFAFVPHCLFLPTCKQFSLSVRFSPVMRGISEGTRRNVVEFLSPYSGEACHGETQNRGAITWNSFKFWVCKS